MKKEEMFTHEQIDDLLATGPSPEEFNRLCVQARAALTPARDGGLEELTREQRDMLTAIRWRAAKFVHKVRSGLAQSKETFADMNWIIEQIDAALSRPSHSERDSALEEAAKVCDEINRNSGGGLETFAESIRALRSAQPAAGMVSASEDKAYLNGLRAGWNLGVKGDEAGMKSAVNAYQTALSAAPSPGSGEKPERRER